MINHHPSHHLLSQFVAGELPASLSAAIAMHNEFCTQCKINADIMTEQLAESLFDTDNAQGSALHKSSDVNIEFNIDDMIDSITTLEQLTNEAENKPVSIEVKGNHYVLPRAIQHMNIGKWRSIGKLTRARIQLDEDEIHSSLLQIDAGGGVPEHTHKGYELTLLLSGEFQDENGRYVPGDFIMLDTSHKHTPYSLSGCLCFTVANAPQHFTQGVNKLLNPVGSLIY